MSRLHSSLKVTFLGLLVTASAGSSDWPQYRGPNRDGRSSEQGLLRQWPAEGPRELWRVQLGSGYSGIAIADGRAFTLFGSGGKEFAAAFDIRDGRQLWRFEMGAEFRSNQGDGPRSTPTVDGDLVYVVDARSRLFALAVDSGELRWSSDLVAEWGAKVPEWGSASSPLVEGQQLIVDVAGRADHAIVAFDKDSGEMIWHSGTHRPAYSSPIAVTLGGERQVVLFTAEGVRGVSIEGGRELWMFPWTTDWDVNAATPVFVPRNGVFISSGYDTGAALVRIDRNGGELEARQAWRNRAMKNHFNSSVLVGAYLYGFDMDNLKCLEAATGEEKWRARGDFSKGSLLFADGFLLVMGGQGRLGLVEATPEAYRLHSRAKVFDGKSWTMPSLSNGVLYVRDFGTMVALLVREAADQGAGSGD